MNSLIILFLAFNLANASCPFTSKKEEAPKDVADLETTTPNGCTCTSLCGATVGDLFKVSVWRQVYQSYKSSHLINSP